MQTIDDFQQLQIDHRDVVVSGDGDVSPGAVWGDQDARRFLAERNALEFLAGGVIEDEQIARVEVGNQHEAAVGREAEAIGSFGLHGEGVSDTLGGQVDDGDAAIAGVGGPDLFAIRRDVEALGALAHWHDRLVIVDGSGALENAAPVPERFSRPPSNCGCDGSSPAASRPRLTMRSAIIMLRRTDIFSRSNWSRSSCTMKNSRDCLRVSSSCAGSHGLVTYL